MRAELVRKETSDGVRLDGAFLAPAVERPEDLGFDAALLVHGTGANFYSSSLLRHLALSFRDLGIASLLANTRGRDLIHTASTASGPKLLGAAYEIVGDCTYDLPAWLDFLRERGYARLAIVGHSLGALKGVYTLAQSPRDDVSRLIAISPARLSHSHFLNSDQANVFQAGLDEAHRHVNAGEPEKLMQVRFPIPYLATAASVLDKYGPEESYDILKFVPRLPVPTLFTFGDRELASHPAFRGAPEAIEAIAKEENSLQISVAVIAEADHFYAGATESLWQRALRWLRKASAS